MKFKTLLICLLLGLCVVFLYSNAFALYDTKWEWRTLNHEKFTIYFPLGHEEFAARVYSLADEVYGDVTEYFGINPEKCPIVLNPGTDIFNGYYAPFPNRISVFETPAYSSRDLSWGSDLIDDVFTHEFTHFVHITARLGWYDKFCKIFGSGLGIPNIVSPGWVIEGITTNTETLFTDRGRGRSSYFKGKILSMADEDDFWSLNSAGVSSPNRPPGGRIYIAGYHMIEFLRKRYGQDAPVKLARFQAEHPLGGTRDALVHVTGKRPEKFYNEFLKDLRLKKEKAEKKAMSIDLPAGEEILFNSLDNIYSYYWNGNNITAFVKGYDEKGRFITINPVTKKIIDRFYSGNLSLISEVKRNNDKLYFSSSYLHKLGGFDLARADLTMMDLKNRKVLRLTENQGIYSVDFSNERNIYAGVKREGMWSKLVLLDENGEYIRDLVSKKGLYFEKPVWSPDSSYLAAVVKSGNNTDIVVVDFETKEMSTLFKSDAYEDNDPFFTKDGKWIIFSSDRSGTWNIFAWNLENKKLFQLTSVFYGATFPKVSHDLKYLSFLSLKKGVNSLMISEFKPETGIEVKVEKGKVVNEPPVLKSSPIKNIKVHGIPFAEAYKPFIHAPYFISDEEGSVAGLFIMGRDPVGLNSYSGSLFYGLDSQRPGYDILFTNKYFIPSINLRTYDTCEELDAIRGYELWQRERGAEFYLGIENYWKTIPSYITSYLNIGGKYRYYSGLKDLRFRSDMNEISSLFTDFTIMRLPDSAPRDMVNLNGQSLFLSYENGGDYLGSELSGENFISQLKQYLPSFIKHQGFELTAAYQSQSGDLIYSRELSVPRGYSDDGDDVLDYDNNLLFQMEYHFPIRYTDFGFGLYLIHFNLFKGSLFADYGGGWSDEFDYDEFKDTARTSIGGTITTRAALFSIFNFESGISAGYKTKEDESFVNFIFKALL